MGLFLTSLQMLSPVGTEEMTAEISEDVLGSSTRPSHTRNLDTCMARRSSVDFNLGVSSSGINNCEWTVEDVSEVPMAGEEEEDKRKRRGTFNSAQTQANKARHNAGTTPSTRPLHRQPSRLIRLWGLLSILGTCKLSCSFMMHSLHPNGAESCHSFSQQTHRLRLRSRSRSLSCSTTSYGLARITLLSSIALWCLDSGATYLLLTSSEQLSSIQQFFARCPPEVFEPYCQ